MENTLFLSTILISFSVLLIPFSTNAQLSSAESRILFQVQEFLEFPGVLQTWNNWTNFCYIPQSSSLVVVCSGNHITELTIVGNKTSKNFPGKKFEISQQTLSKKFSTDSFFTVLTKLSSLKKLSLVSLGIWGPLPSKVNRFYSLEVLNLSSNYIYGSIPSSISTFKNLKSLVLVDNLLNGTVPDLKGLVKLEEIDLSVNQLGPKLPSLGNNLVKIVLKNNSFRSEIAKEFVKFNRLQQLDLSFNKLVGPIPSFLFSLPSIEYINLGRNQLNGALSDSILCNGKLRFVDVSNNLLIGKLPTCLGSKVGNRTVVNLWNCLSNSSTKYQRPASFCQKEALAVKPPVRDPKGQKKEEESATLKLGIVLGIIGGVVAILGALGVLILVIYRRRIERTRGGDKSESFAIEKSPIRGSPIGDGRRAPRAMRMTSLNLPPYHVFTLEEMEDATNNFDPSNLVGEGSQCQIYRGTVRDGSVVLVRCLKLKQKHSPQSLQQQMDVISKLRHRHLVSVLGHCIVTYQGHPNTSSTVFIVLENIRNGSLKDHLSDWRRRDVLKWPQRMGIIMGIAKGIQYLHTGGVTGNDLKIENVLLDDNLTPKISGFNISLLSKVGAENPMNGQDNSNHSPEKEDIHQLGVILLEVITGRPIESVSELDDLKLQTEISLAESPAKLRDLTDPSIRGTFAHDSLKTAVQIAINCLSKDASSRPPIEDVIWHIQYSVQVQEGWNSSGNLSTKF